MMSSVQLKSSSEEKMNMYETMVEDLVNSDESSRYMLDGKSWHSNYTRFLCFLFISIFSSGSRRRFPEPNKFAFNDD